MTRASAIAMSLRGFGCGLVGVLPFIGLLPSIHALRCWFRVRSDYREDWNPASAYLYWGAVLAALGLLGTVLTTAVIGYSIAVSYY